VDGDDIVFGEMKVREPERRSRPDRDRKYACLAYEVPAPIDLPIYLDRRTADAIERHALSDTSVELGGILLGKECVDPSTGQPFVWVTQSLEAKHYANTQASFTYTHDSWEEITRERDRLHPEFDIVGWYHTHPSFGIFLSHHDLFIHQHFFAQPLQVAYVVDPINQTRGFFQWRDGGLAQVGGYYLTADRGDRVALARLANDLEKLPNPEGGGGGSLSPRLEAELIKMLTRPAPSYTSSPAERLQLATLFGMLGTFVGILGVALALWLYQLQSRVQEQNDAVMALARSVEQLGDNQRLTTDTVIRKLGAEKAEDYLAQYTKTAKDRDEAQRLLAVQRSMSEDLGTRVKGLAEILQSKQKELDKSKEDAKDAPKLRDRIASLEEKNDRKQHQLDELEPFLKKSREDGFDIELLIQDRNRTRYIAYAGWGISALLAFGLIAAFFFYKPPLPDEVAPPSPDGERPTHRIV
jgi:proteasome lid subunit RPN8/RPN11/Tfp pilus assembly protein PilN